ncbi:FmdB family zinc ribbon protein [Candidatus Electronema sp. PJ]|jgi:putative FmdB family regulatory protein|uniref:FmdB family zinc ribbon protein n=1 Tax=Candidatus Electronema sp. PJ TaxID=3401572 RepID=UPI003AA9137D
MPVYEYKCSTCDRVFEMQQKISDPPLTVCSECGGAMKKLVSASAFHLKGGGWYADGYSSGGCSNKTKAGESKTGQACTGGGEGGGCASCPVVS